MNDMFKSKIYFHYLELTCLLQRVHELRDRLQQQAWEGDTLIPRLVKYHHQVKSSI